MYGAAGLALKNKQTNKTIKLPFPPMPPLPPPSPISTPRQSNSVFLRMQNEAFELRDMSSSLSKLLLADTGIFGWLKSSTACSQSVMTRDTSQSYGTASPPPHPPHPPTTTRLPHAPTHPPHIHVQIGRLCYNDSRLAGQNTALCLSVLTEAGVKHPATLGFWLAGGYDREYPTHHPTITVVRLPSRDQDADWVRRHVQDFLGSKAMDRVEKVSRI